MRIATKLLVNGALPVALVLAAGLVLGLARRHMYRLRDDRRIASEVVSDASALMPLASEVAMGNARAKRQWLAHHASLGALLARHVPLTPEGRAILATLRREIDDLGAVYRLAEQYQEATAVSAPGGARELEVEARLRGRMSLLSMRMVGDALRLAGHAQDEIVAAEKRADRLVMLCALGAALVAVAVSWLVGRSVLQPLRVLGQGAARVGQGDFSQAVALDASDEVGEVASAFNAMMRSLNASHAALMEENARRKLSEARTAHLNAVLRAIRNVNQLITHEKDTGRLLREACNRIIETRGYFAAWVVLIDRDGRPGAFTQAGLDDRQAALARALADGSAPSYVRRAMERPGVVFAAGEAAPCARTGPGPDRPEEEETLGVRLEHAGRVFGALVVSAPAAAARDEEEQSLLCEVAQDLALALHGIETEERRCRAEADLQRHREHLEEVVARRTAQLRRSNQDLEQFAYVASHDLQEPLRKVRAFGDLLRDECAALSDDGRDYVSRMQDAALRMQGLISGLLTFSRVTTRGTPFARVAMDDVVRAVLCDLEARVAETQGRVDVGPLPEIEADPLQMRQLMQNLIGNALKFHRKDEPPRVKIHALAPDQLPEPARGRPGGEPLCGIAVEDNGIGFDEKHSERIFTIFQRLHSRADYEGSGIGLAVCRRIVQRHGGCIVARGTPGRGSVFTVCLPVRQPRPEPDGDDWLP